MRRPDSLVRTRIRRAPPALALALVAALACASGGGRDAARTARLNDARRRAAARVEAHRAREALELLEPLQKELDGDPLVFVLSGRAYADLGRTDDAVRAFEHAMRLDYTRADAHLGLATVLMRAGRTGRARTEFDLALRYGEDDPVVLYDCGVAMAELGRRDEAVRFWRRAAERAPADARPARALGEALSESRPAEALRWLDRADSLAGADAATHAARGRALARLGQDEAARRELVRAVRADPNTPRYRFDLAAFDLRAGRLDSALAGWDALVERFGRRWSWRVYRARTLVGLGRGADALRELEPALVRADSIVRAGGDPGFDRTPPGLDEAWDVVALARRAQGDLEGALAAARRAVELAPRNAVRRVNLGVILAEMGRVDEARAQWRRALELDPDNAAARANIESVQPSGR